MWHSDHFGINANRFDTAGSPLLGGYDNPAPGAGQAPPGAPLACEQIF
jgi:hypothetical protein